MKDAGMKRVMALVFPVAAMCAAAQGQGPELNWFTIDVGGGSMSGPNNLTLDGTIGQHDAGVLSGNGFELSGGFWGFQETVGCYANCDGSTIGPVLNVLDFACFLNKFAAGEAYANCDESTIAPVLNVLDFACFLNKFAAGCS